MSVPSLVHVTAESGMASSSLRARRPRGESRRAGPVRDPDLLASFLEDAAHFSGGHSSGIVFAASEADVASLLRDAPSVLPIAAQSSLTGGATPRGEVLLSTTRLNRIIEIGTDRARVQAGVTLAELDAGLDQVGRYYPPAPTFKGACVGGTIATNAAGAATFKYGTTRNWVQAITVVLATGDVLDIERGATRAHPDGYFEILLADRAVRVPVPRYQMPAVPKLSAGYFARPDMDLIDLFIGSEGTLGVITEVTLRVLPVRPALCLAFVPFANRGAAFALVHRLRRLTQETWRTGEPGGIDVSAIEHMDARSLALLREDGVDRANGIALRPDASIALLITAELSAGTNASDAFDQIGRARDEDAPDTPLVRFCQALDQAGVLGDVEVAVPDDRARAAQLLAVREAVPAAVNQRVGRAKATFDARIEKTAADLNRPVRSARRAARAVRWRVWAAGARRGRLGTHLGWPRAPECHPALA